MIEKQYRWIIWGIVLGALITPVLKYYAPKVAKFYSAPQRCTTVISSEGSSEYCLTEKFRPPIECFFEEERSKSRECLALKSLSERNKKEVSFSIFGHLITIKRELAKPEE